MLEKILNLTPESDLDYDTAIKAIRYLESSIIGFVAFIALSILAARGEPGFAAFGGLALYGSLMCHRMYIGWMSKARASLSWLDPSDYMGIFISAFLRAWVAGFVTLVVFSATHGASM